MSNLQVVARQAFDLVVYLSPVIEQLVGHVAEVLDAWQREHELAEAFLEPLELLVFDSGHDGKDLQRDCSYTRLHQAVLVIVEFDGHLIQWERAQHFVFRIVERSDAVGAQVQTHLLEEGNVLIGVQLRAELRVFADAHACGPRTIKRHPFLA